MFKQAVLLLFVVSVISSAIATNAIYVGEYWKAGNTEEIKVDTDMVYENVRILIRDSGEEILLNSNMYQKNDNLWVLDYYVASNAKKDIYTIEFQMERSNGMTENRIIETEVRELTFFDRVFLFIRTYFKLFRK